MDPYARLHLVNRVLESAPLLAFAAAWLRRRHIPYEFKPIYYYVGVEAFFYFLDRLSRITVHNNMYLYHLGTVVLVFFFTQTYSRILPPSRIRSAIPIGLTLFYTVAFLDAAFLDGLFTMTNRYSHPVGCAVLLILAMVHIAHLTTDSRYDLLNKEPGFFLSLAVLIYCSCSFITHVGVTILYSSGFDAKTILMLDYIFETPDVVLLAVAMALLAWMFSFYPLSTNPRRALPKWLHYSSWHPRPFRLLHQPFTEQLPSKELQKC
jgi:hypothetical protein